MKGTTPLIVVSLVANLALGAAWLWRPPGARPDEKSAAASLATPQGAGAAASVAGGGQAGGGHQAEAATHTDPAALRDRLRALGFSEPLVRAAVRAQIEAPRLARERERRAAAPAVPWWRPDLSVTDLYAKVSPEDRARRQAERAEIVRVLGPGASAVPAEAELYAFLPSDKADRLAEIRREMIERRDEIPVGSGSPATRTEAVARRAAIMKEWEEAQKAFLTPEERTEYDRRLASASYSIRSAAPYFAGTLAEYEAIFGLLHPYLELLNGPMANAPVEARGRSTLDASQKFRSDLAAALGAERYVEWQRSAQQADYTARIDLQRRFNVAPATLDALAALVRTVSDESMALTRDRDRSAGGDTSADLRALAASARTRVRALLGDDLGTAYNDASARSWLQHLERGSGFFDQPDGTRAIFGVPQTARPAVATPRPVTPAGAAPPPSPKNQ